VHRWLTETYWSKGNPREYIERCMNGAQLVVGAYLNEQQVAYMRLVSDGVTFGWLSDVYVAEEHRGKGLGRELVRFVLEHPDFRDLKRWLLATTDAHGVYASLGFQPLPNPEAYMVRGKAEFD
jgi:GNAT superfamily N-acetyltransferase